MPVGSLLTYSGSSTQHKLDSAGRLVIGGTFRLVGVCDLNTSAAIASGATVDVLDGATFDIQGDGNLSDTFFDNFGQLRKGTVSNAGLFTKSSGSGTSLVTDDWTIDNLAGGELTVSSGTLQFSRNGNGFNNAGLAQVAAGTLRVGGGTSTGTFDVEVGGTLQFVTSSSVSVVHVLDGATINNNGTLEIDGQVRFNNGATITGDRTLSLIGDDAEIGGSEPITLDHFNWTAGRLANSGGLTVAAGGTMAISGSGKEAGQQRVAVDLRHRNLGWHPEHRQSGVCGGARAGGNWLGGHTRSAGGRRSVGKPWFGRFQWRSVAD